MISNQGITGGIGLLRIYNDDHESPHNDDELLADVSQDAMRLAGLGKMDPHLSFCKARSIPKPNNGLI